MNKNNAPLVSILIPTYERSAMLKRAIESAQLQSYKNICINIFDDGSKDDTQSVVESLRANDERVIYFRHPSNIGMLPNIKYVFNSVRTKYFSILTDDDALTSSFIEDAISVLEENPDIAFVALESIHVDDELNLCGESGVKNDGSLIFYRSQESFSVMHSWSIPLTLISVLFRSEVAEIYQEIDESRDVGSDIRFLFHAAARYNFAYLAKVGALVAGHAASFGSMRGVVNWEHEVVQLCRYTEIMNDSRISDEIHALAKIYMVSLLNAKRNKYYVNAIFRGIVRAHLLGDDLYYKRNEAAISELRFAGKTLTCAFLDYFNRSSVAKKAIQITLYRLYFARKNLRTKKYAELQKTKYRDVFIKAS